jgi:serine protease Do
MDDVQREPCPRCGEPAAIAGRVCRHCGASLLVDVVAARIADAGARYRAARDLARLGPEFPRLLRGEELLAAPESIVASGITREVARKALDVLAKSGGKGRLVAFAQGEPAGAVAAELERPVLSKGRRWLRGFLSVALLAASIVWLVRPRPSVPVRRAVSPTASPSKAVEPARAAPPLRDVAAGALDSSASVTCGNSSGAGFFVEEDLLLTNDHVLCPGNAAPLIELRDHRRLPGRIERRDPWLDAALVRVPGAGVRPLSPGDATALEPGDTVLAIGNPIRMDFTVTRGIVSHGERNVYGIAYVQFDANVNPGNSGGPLLDQDGRVVGIVSMMVSNARGLALALPVNYLYEWGVRLPSPPPRFDLWQSLLTRVKKLDERDVAQARDALKSPGLGGASIDPEGGVYAFLLVRGQPAGARPFRFELVREGKVLCNPAGIVESWDLMKADRRDPTRDSRYLRWLEKNGLAVGIFVGTAPLRWEGCPDPSSALGAQLVLEDGDPGSSRAVIRMYRQAS